MVVLYECTDVAAVQLFADKLLLLLFFLELFVFFYDLKLVPRGRDFHILVKNELLLTDAVE